MTFLKQDYCKIILKKDYIISQLEAKIESLNRNTNTNNTNNENTFRELEEENEMNKKERKRRRNHWKY